jgi:hypothetical protein
MTPKSLQVALSLVNGTQIARIQTRNSKVKKTSKRRAFLAGLFLYSRVERKTWHSLSPQWHRLIFARLLSQNNGVLLCRSCRSAVR